MRTNWFDRPIYHSKWDFDICRLRELNYLKGKISTDVSSVNQQKEKLEKVLPNVNSVTEGINVYRQYYTEEMEKQNGVIAIRFNRI